MDLISQGLTRPSRERLAAAMGLAAQAEDGALPATQGTLRDLTEAAGVLRTEVRFLQEETADRWRTIREMSQAMRPKRRGY